jgi:hypothetical protein
VDEFEIEGLNVPELHVVQVGWLVVDPAVAEYFPAGHLVWGEHESVDVGEFEVEVPVVQRIHAMPFR